VNWILLAARFIGGTAVVVCAGCGTGAAEGGGAVGDRVPDASPVSLDGNSSDRAFLKSAEQLLVKRCMEAKGLRYVAKRVTPEDIEESGAGDRALSGDDVPRARREGYGLTGRVDERRLADPNGDYVLTLSPARQRQWSAALYGDLKNGIKVEVPGVGTMQASSKGCLADAQRMLYGDYAKWKAADARVRNRHGQIGAWVRADSGYTSAISKWRSCMQGKGYRFTDPNAATSDAVRRFGGRAAFKSQEIRLAVADAECNRDAGVAKAVRELTDKHTRRWVSENEGPVIEVQAMRAAALTKAKQLVG